MMSKEQGLRYQKLKQKVDRWEKLGCDEQQRRKRVWRHNSFLGHVAMAKRNMQTLGDAPSVSDKANALASQIWLLLTELDTELRANRIDQ